MKEVLFATENESKANRFRDKLLEHNIKLLTINDLDEKLEVEENGASAIENAIIKAKAYANIYNIAVFAMDDNLYIDDIPESKQPGMFVRRVKGKRLTDEEMIEHYSSLAHVYGKDGKLIAKWVYGLAIIINDDIKTFSWSKENFYITDTPSNKINPGYPLNSISKNIKLNKYFTDMTDADKKNTKNNDDEVIEFLLKHLNESITR